MELFSDRFYVEVVAGLRGIGYHETLLEEDYEFIDYFSANKEHRQIAAAAFGQTPTSYDSVCIGVALANGHREHNLVNHFRALGAPIILEVDNVEVREWAVSRKAGEHGLIGRYPADRITQMFEHRAREWRPELLLRAKNIGSFNEASQLSLFAGLLPELENKIHAQLEPLLHNALSDTRAVYRDINGHNPKPRELFRLIFWILTAKVFHDRRVNGFKRLGPDPDDILAAVAREYGEDAVPRLLNQRARETAVACIWNHLDFRNLSVEVLSQMWSTMLLDTDTKQRLGIHRTPRTIVNYIVNRIPLQQPGDDPRIIFEPCSGSAAFLIGVMNALRSNLFLMTPIERHKYFTNHIAAIEKDDFGVEISHLALALADWPNLSGWTKRVTQADVFDDGVLANYVSRAGVVLCNPPFEDLRPEERERQLYSPKKPVELLNRVLDDLHPSGVLGFVVPRNFVDGQGYREIRKRIAGRFANIELTVLPDRAFDDADTEVGLLVATEPIPHDTCKIAFHKVNDTAEAWKQFKLTHKVSSEHKTTRTATDAAETFAVYELPSVWRFQTSSPTLRDVAKLHRGLEWNKKLIVKGKETGFRADAVRDTPSDKFRLGVAPQTRFRAFELPGLHYLSFRPQDERGHSYNRKWEQPKAIVNKSTHSRGPWRMAAFADTEGIAFYQTYIGVWPTTSDYDEVILAAILNSPVANAFVAGREGKTDITLETLKDLPMPRFTAPQRTKLRQLVEQYQNLITSSPIHTGALIDPTPLLMEIDALILDGYHLPPRLENEVLQFFTGHGKDRPTVHTFEDYLPPDCEVYFSLSAHLSSKFKNATIGNLLERLSA
jgi:N-6 DNA Methylase